MRHRGWMLWMMPLLLLAPLAGSPASPDQALWKLGSFTWVKLVPAEPGASPNAQPVAISPEVLQATLGPVLAKDDGEDIPLFGRKELLELSKALSEALSLAQPGEDVALLSTSRHGHGFLERATGLTARLFVRDGALNLIVQDARLNFLDSYQMDNLEPTFTYGSRQAASKASLQAPRARRLRPDWLALPLALPAPSLMAPAPATPLAPRPIPAPPVAPVAVTPVPATTASPSAAPKAAPAEDAASEAKAQRLRTLKRLRDENLISEAEYQAKREALLKAL